MMRRTILLPGLAALFLAVSAENCIMEERDVDVVVTGDIPATWTTQGSNSSGSEQATINAAAEVEDALDDLDDDSEIQSINIAGGTYEVLDNRGFVGSHSGTVYVSAQGQPELQVLLFDAPSNATGASGGTTVDVTLVKAGVDFLNARLNQYLATRDSNLLQLTFRADWTSTNPGGSQYDFDWKTALVLQIVGTINLEVPNP